MPGESHGQRSLAGYRPRGYKSQTRLSDRNHRYPQEGRSETLPPGSLHRPLSPIHQKLSSVTQLSPTLLHPMDCSAPGLPVHHQLPEFTQTHVHQINDAIQPSHSVVPFSSCPQSFPASGSFPMSQLFASGGQSIGVSASTLVLPMNTQD